MKRQQQKSTAPAVRSAATSKPAAPRTPTRRAGTSAKATSSPAKTTASTRPAPRQKSASPKAAPPPATIPDLYGSIHALLHTMRLIEQHEEALCSMHDEMKRTGKLSAPHRRKLHILVHELPADDYQADLQALRYALAAQNL